MPDRDYWLDLFTGTTWEEFTAAGSSVSGFRESRWKTLQRVKPGDYLLCYLTGVSRFIGVLEVTSQAFRDSTPVWADEDFPCRVKVKPVVALTPQTAVPVKLLRGKLTVFENLTSPHAWTGHFRGSPAKWKRTDGEAVVEALLEAQQNPQVRPVDKRKLARRPRSLKAKMGSVTVPEDEPEEVTDSAAGPAPSEHTEIQALLLKLGSDMGFGVWVARNDRNREFAGSTLSGFANSRTELPLQFDDATNRTIELIDVLWLQGNAIVAAFEVESTTSVYSGLLRMSDLLAMQPNINIPLYIVAPDDKRSKVMSEVNRPTFSRLTPPLSEVCRFVSFSSLRDGLSEYSSVLQYLKPEFLEEVSESCEIEEA